MSSIFFELLICAFGSKKKGYFTQQKPVVINNGGKIRTSSREKWL